MRQNNSKHIAKSVWFTSVIKSFANFYFMSYSVQKQLGEINDDVSV